MSQSWSLAVKVVKYWEEFKVDICGVDIGGGVDLEYILMSTSTLVMAEYKYISKSLVRLHLHEYEYILYDIVNY